LGDDDWDTMSGGWYWQFPTEKRGASKINSSKGVKKEGPLKWTFRKLKCGFTATKCTVRIHPELICAVQLENQELVQFMQEDAAATCISLNTQGSRVPDLGT
jgi:hypothetical protein